MRSGGAGGRRRPKPLLEVRGKRIVRLRKLK
jgi:hypothetical protein